MKTPLSFVLCLSSSLVFAATYGTLDDKSNFVAAPPTVVFDNGLHVTSHITEPQANALGYKLLVDQPPTCASNEYAVATGYDYDSETSGLRIRRNYRIETIVPPPRKFSKLKIYVGLATLGRWEEVEAWLKGKTFGDVNGLTAFNLAQEISEDHELFKPLLAEAKALLGWDDATANEFLNGCILM